MHPVTKSASKSDPERNSSIFKFWHKKILPICTWPDLMWLNPNLTPQNFNFSNIIQYKLSQILFNFVLT